MKKPDEEVVEYALRGKRECEEMLSTMTFPELVETYRRERHGRRRVSVLVLLRTRVGRVKTAREVIRIRKKYGKADSSS